MPRFETFRRTPGAIFMDLRIRNPIAHTPSDRLPPREANRSALDATRDQRQPWGERRRAETEPAQDFNPGSSDAGLSY
jgi:hypothetical protein